jgi:rubrerythrin
MDKKEIIKRLNKLADIEEEYALKLNDVTGFGNEQVMMLIKSIGYDSQKHAGLYRAAANILEGKSMSIMGSEIEDLEDDLKDHVRVEKQMIRQVKEIKNEIKDDRVKALLEVIETDEEYHHPLMEKILEIVLKPEILEDEEVWKMMVGYLPRHGHVLDPYADLDYKGTS